MADEGTGDCHICGVDPIEYERVPMGLTEMSLCRECYDEFKRREKAKLEQLDEEAQ